MTREEAALRKAKDELDSAIYLSECGINAGIRAIFFKKAEWLATLIYLAEKALAHQSELVKERERQKKDSNMECLCVAIDGMHEWECVGASTVGFTYRCRVCGNIKSESYNPNGNGVTISSNFNSGGREH